MTALEPEGPAVTSSQQERGGVRKKTAVSAARLA